MKRLVGYDSESKEHSPETLRHHLYGGHVADYMKYLMEEDEEKYKAHFSRFIKEGVSADNVSGWERWRGIFGDVYLLCLILSAGADVPRSTCQDQGRSSCHEEAQERRC